MLGQNNLEGFYIQLILIAIVPILLLRWITKDKKSFDTVLSNVLLIASLPIGIFLEFPILNSCCGGPSTGYEWHGIILGVSGFLTGILLRISFNKKAILYFSFFIAILTITSLTFFSLGRVGVGVPVNYLSNASDCRDYIGGCICPGNPVPLTTSGSPIRDVYDSDGCGLGRTSRDAQALNIIFYLIISAGLTHALFNRFIRRLNTHNKKFD